MTLFVMLVALLVAVWVYMTLWFGLARWSDRTDVVDSAWGLGFVYVAWLAFAIGQHHLATQWLTAGFVTIWGVRLFLHLTTRNMKKTEDYRYVAYREKWGKDYWQKAYVRIFMTQAILLWVISLTVVASMASSSVRWSWLAIAGFVVWAFGIIFETVGDWQLRQFMKTRKKGQIMTTGLWRYSRHPNYFGEVAAWCGAGLVAVSLGQWWGLLGSLTITILILKVSGIPPLEKHYEGNQTFEKYKKRTSILFPLPRR